jgi:hypothetical protein
VSSSTAELTAIDSRARPGASVSALSKWFHGGRLYITLSVIALTIGALSLLFPSTPSYDPWSWIVWGREIVHFKLTTTGGPTWKPLPVIFTTIFALFGKAEPNLWLIIARAGALMAVVMVFKVSARLTWWLGTPPAEDASFGERLLSRTPGLLAGAIAAIGLAFSGGFISDNMLGYSEGFMTALVLIAVERGLDGHHRQAFAIGFAAALDRPEIWLFWGPYGLWLFWKDPEARSLVVALFVLIPVLWFLPEKWGSGQFFRGVSRAQHVRSNSPALAACPFCTLLKGHAWPTVLLRIKIFAGIGVVASLAVLYRAGFGRRRWRLSGDREWGLIGIAASGIAGLVWFVVIAILTQAGFSGNDRYLVLGSALIEISGAATWGWFVLELGTRGRALLSRGGRSISETVARVAAVAIAVFVFLFVPNFVGSNLIDLQRTHGSLVYQARLRSDLANIVRDYGGAKKLLACGPVMTEGFQVPLVAWTLGLHTDQVMAPPTLAPAQPPVAGPPVVLQAAAQRKRTPLPIMHEFTNYTSYKIVERTRSFTLLTNCGK